MKKPFLDRPYDWTRTPRTSEFLREEYPTHTGDRWVFYVAIFGAGVIAGLMAAGWA